MENLNKIQNSDIYEEDMKEYGQHIIPLIREGLEINVFCSFAYLTPNYSVLFALDELKRRLDQINYKLFVVFWDMNSLANPYFKKNISNRRIKNSEEYINEKMKELKDVIISRGFPQDRLILYKSSDLWRRLVSFKGEDLFQNFYSILSSINIKEFIGTNKVSNTFQIPLDIFFCNYLPQLFPEDIKKPIDIAFLGNNKLKIYKIIREKMISEGLTFLKRPLFLILKDFPYLNLRGYVPEWNMSLKEISEIINSCDLNRDDISSLGRNIILSGYSKLTDYKEFSDLCKNEKISKLKTQISKSIYEYLTECNLIFFSIFSRGFEEGIRDLSSIEEIRKVGNLLRSRIALGIFLLSDGTKNTTSIAKILKKSVPTISTYANRLKKLNLVKVLENNNIKRTISGVKINFDLGIKKEN